MRISSKSTETVSAGTEEGPAVSIVVPTKDRPDLLDQCLRTIVAEMRAGDELIVVDSASRDPLVRTVAESHGANYVRMDLRGASRARNAGWRAARHDLIAFVDDDVFVSPGWRAAVGSALARRPGLGLLTGRVEVPPHQLAHGRYTASVEPWLDERPFGRWDARRSGISGNLVCRRDALEGVGGFDELLGPGTSFRSGEDKDIFDRVVAAGFSGCYDPTVLAFHDQWRSRRERFRLEWDYGIAAGAYFAKVVRIDRRRIRGVAGDLIWTWCVKDFFRCARNGYKTGMLCAVIRSVGLILGFARAIVVPVRGGHFKKRS